MYDIYFCKYILLGIPISFFTLIGTIMCKEYYLQKKKKLK